VSVQESYSSIILSLLPLPLANHRLAKVLLILQIRLSSLIPKHMLLYQLDEVPVVPASSHYEVPLKQCVELFLDLFPFPSALHDRISFVWLRRAVSSACLIVCALLATVLIVYIMLFALEETLNLLLYLAWRLMLQLYILIR